MLFCSLTDLLDRRMVKNLIRLLICKALDPVADKLTLRLYLRTGVSISRTVFQRKIFCKNGSAFLQKRQNTGWTCNCLIYTVTLFFNFFTDTLLLTVSSGDGEYLNLYHGSRDANRLVYVYAHILADEKRNWGGWDCPWNK